VSAARPLRVAVTRDESLDGPLTQALRGRGLEPMSCPVLAEAPPRDPEPLARAARDLERYEWLVVASTRAITALIQARDGRDLPAGLRTAAVGAKTAAALVAHGARDPVIAPAAGAGPLLLVLRDADRWPGRRVLLPRAAEGRPKLSASLRSFGAAVDEVIAYRTVELPPDQIAVSWRAARADAVVVASPSAARALVGAIGTIPLRRLEPVVAIGSTTAMSLTALGVRAVVPERADFESVAALLSQSPIWRCSEVTS
jgi:uroporphyrinogen-III synthase